MLAGYDDDCRYLVCPYGCILGPIDGGWVGPETSSDKLHAKHRHRAHGKAAERPMKIPVLIHVYAVLLAVGVALAITVSFAALDRPRSFEEIEVQRINVVEPDGTKKIVIANGARQADVVIEGQVIAPRSPRPPGLIFLDDNGDEMGGLVFNGGAEGKSAGLFFDKHANDQVLGLSHVEWQRDGQYASQSGIQIWDRPADYFESGERLRRARALEDPDARREAFASINADGVFGHRRVFAGRHEDGAATLRLSDASGRLRLQILVTDAGDARIEFLDADGNVTRTITP